MATQETIGVDGLHCDACEQAIQRALQRVDGVQHVRADHVAGTVSVRFDPDRITPGGLTERIRDAGYDPRE